MRQYPYALHSKLHHPSDSIISCKAWAWGTVRGNPSNITIPDFSNVFLSHALAISIIRLSEISLPDFIAKSICLPISVCCAICSLHKLPVESCCHPSRFTQRCESEPLPEPGGPKKYKNVFSATAVAGASYHLLTATLLFILPELKNDPYLYSIKIRFDLSGSFKSDTNHNQQRSSANNKRYIKKACKKIRRNGQKTQINSAYQAQYESRI